MNKPVETRIRDHLAGRELLSDEAWGPLLEELETGLNAGAEVDRELVLALLTMHPDRIDRHLPAARADRLFRLFEEGVTAEPVDHKETRDMLVALAARTYGDCGEPAQSQPEPPTLLERILSVLRPLALLAAGAAAGAIVMVKLAPGPPVDVVRSPGPSAVSASGDQRFELASLFPGYSPDHHEAGPTARAVRGAPLAAALWFDRRDGTYRSGDEVKLGLRISRAAHVILVDLATDGKIQLIPLGAGRAGSPLEPGQLHEYPSPPSRLLLEGPPGSEDLLLVATTMPLPDDLLREEPARTAPPISGERVRLLDGIRDRVRDWAHRNGVEVGFARAHATVIERSK
ncbi:MAG: DUF4384 domain-containing protein [Candidatus Riflebacteria bacterium]|nr:DUF4384 domain-containing protein [Candidatus Riflebacteria bacterium]